MYVLRIRIFYFANLHVLHCSEELRSPSSISFLSNDEDSRLILDRIGCGSGRTAIRWYKWRLGEKVNASSFRCNKLGVDLGLTYVNTFYCNFTLHCVVAKPQGLFWHVLRIVWWRKQVRKLWNTNNVCGSKVCVFSVRQPWDFQLFLIVIYRDTLLFLVQATSNEF